MPINKDVCYMAFKDVASKYLKDDEIEEFMIEHEMRVKEYMADNTTAKQWEAEAAVAEEMGNERIAEAMLAKRNSAYSAMRLVSYYRQIVDGSNYKPSEYVDAIKHIMGGTAGKYHAGASQSVALHMDTCDLKATSSFLHELQRNDLDKYFLKNPNQRDIWIELWELRDKGNPGSTGNTVAKDIAEIMHKHQEAARMEANRNGANIEKLDGYTIAQTHSKDKLRPNIKAGETPDQAFERWYAFTYPRINKGRTLKGVKASGHKRAMREIWDGLYTEVHLDYSSGVGIKAGGNRAERMSNSRKIWFNDGNAAFEYNEAFGEFDLRTGYMQGIRHLARNSALIEKLGANPEKLIDDLHTALKIKATRSGDPKAVELFRHGDNARHWSGNLSDYFDTLTGRVNVSVNETAAKIFQRIRAANSMGSLGMATVSSFSDIGAQLSSATYMGISRSEALKNMTKMIFDWSRRGLTSNERYYLESLGLFSEDLAANFHNAMSQGSVGTGKLAKAMNIYFRAIGLDWWTSSMKKAMALSINHELGSFFSGHPDFKGFNKRMVDMLKSYGLNDKELNLMKNMELIRDGNRVFIDPKNIHNIPENKIAEYLGINKATAGYDSRITAAKHDLETRLHAFILDRVNASVIEPDMLSKVWILQGTQPGTIKGEFFRSMGQFKSFAVSVVSRVLNPWIYNTSGMERGLGLAELIMTTTALGYISICCKEALKGRTAPEMNTKTMMRAMLQGGALGIVGDVLFGEAQNNYDLLQALEGPTIGKINDVYSVYMNALHGDDAAADALKRFRNWIPGQNIFYAKIPLDYLLMYRIQEMANPGYLDRLERNLYNKTGQEYWLSPGEFIK